VLLARRTLPLATSMMDRAMRGGIDPDTGNALIAVLENTATPEQKQKALAFALAASSGTITLPPEAP
jgi:hypothetical protein